jgi:hypothetical protein
MPEDGECDDSDEGDDDEACKTPSDCRRGRHANRDRNTALCRTKYLK